MFSLIWALPLETSCFLFIVIVASKDVEFGVMPIGIGAVLTIP